MKEGIIRIAILTSFLALASTLIGTIVYFGEWTLWHDRHHSLLWAVGFGGLFFIREFCFVVLNPKYRKKQ